MALGIEFPLVRDRVLAVGLLRDARRDAAAISGRLDYGEILLLRTLCVDDLDVADPSGPSGRRRVKNVDLAMDAEASSEGQFLAGPPVPPELLLDYDIVKGERVLNHPPSALDDVRDARPVFYSTLYGGFWVFTRYDDIRAVLQDPGLFEQNEGVPHVSYQRKFIPTRLNPPEHMPYRKLMTAIFAPRQIARLEKVIRQVARQQLAKIAPKGEVDFGTEFALSLPAAMYCSFVGFPIENFQVFNDLSHRLIYEPLEALANEGEAAARAIRQKAMNEIEAILEDLIADCRANPRDDALSILTHGTVFDRPVTHAEAVNMGTLLFSAGTDSTAASITVAHIFLAQNPAHRAAIMAQLDDDEFIWKAAEELNRFHGFHQITRTVARDVEFGGVQLRKGDAVVLPLQSANRDSRKFEDPLVVDFGRRNANNHLTFGAGIHRCLGSHLATAQLRIALQEVHRAIPDYRIDGPVTYMSVGPKATPKSVPFAFTPTEFKA